MPQEELQKDIAHALRILRNGVLPIDTQNCYEKIYPFSNESIISYYNYVNLLNKKALCVTASGDHALYAAAAGANNIECFDMNKLTKYYAALKIALILAYDEKSFFKLFIEKKKKLLTTRINLNDIKPFIAEEYLIFWQEVINSKFFKNNALLFRSDGFGTKLVTNLKALKKSNRFLLTTDFPTEFGLDYELLKARLAKTKITFRDITAQDLLKTTKKKYDAIFLSNILEWISRDYRLNTLKGFINLLNDEGVLYDYHLHGTNISSDYPDPEKTIILGCGCLWDKNQNNEGVLVYKRKNEAKK